MKCMRGMRFLLIAGLALFLIGCGDTVSKSAYDTLAKEKASLEARVKGLEGERDKLLKQKVDLIAQAKALERENESLKAAK